MGPLLLLGVPEPIKLGLRGALSPAGEGRPREAPCAPLGGIGLLLAERGRLPSRPPGCAKSADSTPPLA